ncbi:hypothetical protein, partial [Alienimonas chondri]|uniref:hypothetical protein n=1 Tax=Alienimonas chondri TaxID=2681879 RepID=UPI001488828A
MSDDAHEPADDDRDDAPHGDEGSAVAGAPADGPFDLPAVASLLEMMQRFDVSEIDLKGRDSEGQAQRWHVRRGSLAPVAVAANVP